MTDAPVPTRFADLWPPRDLVVRTPMLDLRLPTEPEIVQLAVLAGAGVNEEPDLPYALPWTVVASPELERNYCQHHAKALGDWKTTNWHLAMAVFVEGEPVGAQSLYGRDFATYRTVVTGSWLGMQWQRRGIGTEMRTAIMHLAFAGLDAQRAETLADLENVSSNLVSERVGYELNGDELKSAHGNVRTMQRYVLRRPAWEARRRSDITIEGLDACRDMFG